MGAIEGFGGWDFERLPSFDRNDLQSVDHLVPDADWFWGGISNYCVVECCGIGAFDFRAHYVAWAMGVSDDEPARIEGLDHWRVAEVPNLDALVGELHAAASLLDEVGDPIVETRKLGALIRPGELADLFRHLAAALDQS